MRPSLFTSLGLSLFAGVHVSAELAVKTVYQFSSNDTWLENIAVRSNGIILATEIGPPASLLAFDPTQANATKQVIHTFDNVLGLSGITELAHDVFYVTGANTTSSNIFDPPANATYVWKVDFNTATGTPNITYVAHPTDLTDINGMTRYNDTIILCSATFESSIYALDVTTGKTWEAFSDSYMTQINGIKVQDDYVYWTATGALYRSKLYTQNFTISAAELIVQASEFDDFAIAPDGFRSNTNRKYVYASTSTDNQIMQISFNKQGGMNQTAIIAGSLNSTEIAEPTGAAFGRGEGQEGKLYVTTGGGSGENVDVDGVETAVGAQLLEIDLS